MRFSIQPGEMVKALSAIHTRSVGRARRNADVALTASVDGLTLATNGATAFIPAQIAVAGSCAVGCDALLRVLRTFPRTEPLAIAVDDGKLVVGRLRMPARFAFVSRETYVTAVTEVVDAARAKQLAQEFVGTRAKLVPCNGAPVGLYNADATKEFFFIVVQRTTEHRVGGTECVAVSKSTGVVRSMGFVGE